MEFYEDYTDQKSGGTEYIEHMTYFGSLYKAVLINYNFKLNFAIERNSI
jgi:hypothetical protein